MNELIGLILVGGKSRRMKQDKGQINYAGKNQTERAFELLGQVCDKVYISCREEQHNEPHLQNLPQIHDLYDNIGPMGGILSAQKNYPKASFLVIACDLPYLNLKVLNNLIEQRDISKIATCYENPEKKWAEPLCSIYEPHSYELLTNSLEQDIRCPRKILSNSDIKRLPIPYINDVNPLDNINTPEEYKVALERLEGVSHAD